MTSLSGITIDPSLLTVNQEGFSLKVFENILLEWARLLGEQWIVITISEYGVDKLYEENMFPSRENLKILFAKMKLYDYDINTISSIIDGVLKKTTSLEEHFKVKDILFEDLSVLPNITTLVPTEGLQLNLKRSLVMFAILLQYCEESIQNYSYLLNKTSDKYIKISAQIHDIDHNRNDLPRKLENPQFIERSVTTVDSFSAFFQNLDEAQMLTHIEEDADVTNIINIIINKNLMFKKVTPEGFEIPHFRIGRDFASSLQERNLTLPLCKKIARAIEESLLRRNMHATHPLRIGLGGNDPQRTRIYDSATAWRRDIDEDYHLHYWLCPDGLLELASIAYPHNDFRIPE